MKHCAGGRAKNHARRDTIVTFYIYYIAAGRYNIVCRYLAAAV